MALAEFMDLGFPTTCVSEPTTCVNGGTVTVWLRIDRFKPNHLFLLSPPALYVKTPDG